jgi:hypothetical protein
MVEKKKKRDLFLTLQHIERFHQRRTVFVVHATLSLVFQVAMWINWFASYAIYGDGFRPDFFSARFIVSLVLVILLIGHLILMRLAESKDRLVVQALQQQQTELKLVEAADDEQVTPMETDSTPASGDAAQVEHQNLSR